MLLCCIKYFRFYLLAWCSSTGFAQRGNIWVLSKGGVDFSSGTAKFYKPPVDTVFIEGLATTCTPNGQLLFFTDGTHIFDQSGQPMPNGMTLMSNPDSVFRSSSTTQAMRCNHSYFPDTTILHRGGRKCLERVHDNIH